MTQLQRRVLDANMMISDAPSERPEFFHAVLCQVGLPRRRQEARTFQRSSGNASLLLEAGSYFVGNGKYQDCPLPYGSKPRLVLYHLCSEAVRTQSPVIDVGGSMAEFLRRVGIGTGGDEFKRFKQQMTALSVCRMTLAHLSPEGRLTQMKAEPLEQFEAWLSADSTQRSFWLDHIELSSKFYNTLIEHAVPLDPRAIHALQHSALALDVYTWLAHRLCRVRKADGVKLYWKSLKDQFGQEYKCPKNFKKEFATALANVRRAYPDANIRDEMGGIRLFSSPPPIPKTQVVVSLSAAKD